MPEETERLSHLLYLRTCQRIPTAYLTNQSRIGSFSFYVDPRVLIPRSFIGHFLIQDGQEWFSDPAPQRILDLCTGSGCLAIIAASLFPESMVDAVDISPDALSVAERNREAYGLCARIRYYESDLFMALPPTQTYDLIMTNPPYVCTESYRSLPREYCHEPALALEAGVDGMIYVDRIMHVAARFMNPGGNLIMEVGYARSLMEERYPGLVMTWLGSETETDLFFIVSREALMAYWEKQSLSE